MKSWKKPTVEQVEKAIALIGRAEHRRFFFDRLGNPNWLPLLHKKGFFKKPPSQIEDKEKQTVSFPLWPESRYLARMAAFLPDEVIKIINGMEKTKNTRVYEDLIDAALNMPAEKAALLTEHVKKWLLLPYHFLLPKKAGDLLSHLAKGGQPEKALDLAKVLLDILPDTKEKDKKFRADPKPRFKDYDYEEILKSDFLELIKTSGIAAINLICSLLQKHTLLSRSKNEDGPKDYSYVWRPKIDKAQHLFAVRDALVDSIRNAAITIIEADKKNIPQIIHILEEKKLHIFDRIALCLLATYPSFSIELIKERLTDFALFESYGVRSEYAQLAKSEASRLSDEERKKVASWIANGPNVELFKKSGVSLHGKEPEQKEIDDYIRRWKLEKMFWFKSILSGELIDEYNALTKQYGEPSLFQFEGVTTSWVQPSSPKTAAEIKAMSDDELFQFLKNWEPEKDFNHGRPKEGLAEVLSTVIAEEPNKFAEISTRFESLDVLYIKALIEGIRNGLKQNRYFSWDKVLDLTESVASRTYQELDQEVINNSTLKYLKDDLTRLFEIGFHQDTKNPIPYELRQKAWGVIALLLKDPDPLVESSKERSEREPISDSLNTVRSQAFHTTMRYALWLKRYEEQQSSASVKKTNNFDSMPEVRSALEQGLNDERETVRSVYGQWFPWIILSDSTWASENGSKIFMTDEDDSDIKRTAWESYIGAVAPYDPAFNILKKQYLFAVEHINEDIFHSKARLENGRALAQHLMTFFWRGLLLPSDPIWTGFWKKASSELRGQALDYIGRSFEATKEPAPADIQERVVKLWEERLSFAEASLNKADSIDEMASFGWWFISEKFHPEWALKQLESALKINPNVDASHLVVKAMVKYANQFPTATMRCLSLMIKSDRDPWAIHMWKDEAKELLGIVIKSKNAEARSLAESIIHELGSRGHLDFGDLLA